MQKPEIVKKAVLILWLILAVGLVRSYLEFERISQQVAVAGGAQFVIMISLFTFAFMALLIHLVSLGKNWARWVFVIFLAIGIIPAIFPLLQSLQHNLFSGILGIGQFIAQIVAAVFLFSKDASTWYKRPK